MNRFLLLLVALAAVALVQLGNWQMRRLDWKTALLHAIETRAFSDPVPAPGKRSWPGINADDDAYLRVKVSGTLLNSHELPVRALTELGGGYWILTPLQTGAGEIIWINRGFVPPDKRFADSRNEPVHQDVTITGLLRLSEPKGTLLQDNEPEAGRWYSRDVDAFSKAEGLPPPAPYFIDADQVSGAADWPRGGLTKLSFSNNHLQYALTWYAMALGLLAGTGYVIWLARRS